MPVKQRIELKNIQAVAASGTALIDIPCGPRYHTIILQHSYASGNNTVVAAMTNLANIKIRVNGRTQREYSGTQLRDLNLLMSGEVGTAGSVAYDATGLPNALTSVPIFFAEPWRKSPIDQDALAWATNGWQSFQIEVTLGSASTPTLKAFAVVDEFQPEKAGGIVKVIRQAFNAGSTSFDIATLDRRDWYQQISIYPDSGGSNAPTKATLKVNGVILHELSASANLALLQGHGMSPGATGRTANIYDLVLDHDDLLGSAVPANGARDMLLTIEAASAMSGTSTLLIQRLGPPE